MALVFVSHSGRDGPPSDDVVEEARRQRMRSVRDALVAALRPDHHVWLDREQLEPAIEWEKAILCGLTRCQAGLLLLDQATVQDPGYVLKEATIFAYRQSVERDFHFVTVALDTEVDRLLAEDRKWKSVALQRWQHILAAGVAVGDVAHAVKAFADGLPEAEQGEIDRAVDQVGSLLFELYRHGHEEQQLADLVEHFRLFDSPYSAAALAQPDRQRVCCQQVAARLLAMEARDVPAVIEVLPRDEERPRIGRVLAANWVPLDVAGPVRAASATSATSTKATWVGMRGPWSDTVSVEKVGKDIVDRGRRSDQTANYKLHTIGEADGEHLFADAAVLADEIERRVLEACPAGASPAGRDRYLKQRRTHVVLRAESTNVLPVAEQAIELVRGRVPQHLTLVVLVDPDLREAPTVEENVADCWIDREAILFAAEVEGVS